MLQCVALTTHLGLAVRSVQGVWPILVVGVAHVRYIYTCERSHNNSWPIIDDIITFRGLRRRMVVESVRVTVVTRVTPVRSVPRGTSMILTRRKNSLAKVIIKTLFQGSLRRL